MNKEIANLFWHGKLTKFEQVCIQSFVKQGFRTKIWSYDNIKVDGAESCDARLVLPEENLFKYKQQFLDPEFGKGKDYPSLAAFSDAFRWNVVNKFGGWWFDTDVYCLKPAEEFFKLRENKPLVAGLQNDGCPSVNSAIFYADEKTSLKLINYFDELCLKYNYSFSEWGVIGPTLITNMIQNEDLINYVVDTEYFYSIEGHQFRCFIDPALKEYAKSLIVDAYVTHIWNSQLTLHNVDKNNPTEQSLLKDFYDDNYTNSSIKNTDSISKYKKSLERYVEISKLYKKIFKRPGDIFGVGNYINSQLPYKEIENIFLQSDEYKNIKR